VFVEAFDSAELEVVGELVEAYVESVAFAVVEAAEVDLVVLQVVLVEHRQVYEPLGPLNTLLRTVKDILYTIRPIDSPRWDHRLVKHLKQRLFPKLLYL
jgi:hypothetical protein